jgi:hypothetical protein
MIVSCRIRVLAVACAAALLALIVHSAALAQAPSESQPDQLRLRSGDLLRGRVLGSSEGVLRFEHPELGVLAIPFERIESYGPVPTAVGSTTDATENPAAPGAEPTSAALANATGSAAAGARGAPVESADSEKDGGWETYIGFALAGNFALNEEVTMRANIGAKRVTPRETTTLEAEYYYRVFNSDVTDNNILAKALQEWNFGDSPWLFFAQGQYQYDEFQPWRHRVSLYVGPGYRLVRTEAMDLAIRLGVGATYENGDVDQVEPEVLIAEDWTWRISPRQTLVLNTSIAPNVEDVADYRVQTQIEYRYLIDDAKRGLSLTAGLRDIYLSKPAPDGEGNELRIYAGLRYDF